MEELNTELQSAPQQAPNPAGKGNKTTIAVLIAIGVVVLIVVCIFGAFFTNYLKNKNFKNGIAGKYKCTDAYIYLAFEGKHTVSEYKGLTLTISDDGKLTARDIVGTCQLKFDGNITSRLIQYEPESGSILLQYVQYFKKGSTYHENYYDVDTLKVGVGESGRTFFLTFEKIE